MAAGAVAVSGAVIAAGAIGTSRQQRGLSAQLDQLRRAGRAHAPTPPPGFTGAVPPPVERYLRWALPGNTRLEEVHIRQAGTLRTDARGERWMPFEADHVVVPPATGFVWNARVRVAPLLHVRVRDSLIEGRGSGQVSLLSAFTIAADGGTPEMHAGSLHRYLAEAVWYPSALLPSSRLRWSAIDAARAMATLTDHGVSVSLEFRFADTGEVTGIYTPARWGQFGGRYEQQPWEGHFRDYRQHEGIFVPTEGDVGWYVDQEWHAVWRGRITALQLRTAR
jgi:hypothetical protein